jgi:hypothetical protein
MLNTFDDLAKCNRENVDAAMKSVDLISKGVQAIAGGAADYSKRSMEQGAKALEKMLSAHSLEKVMEVQSDYIKATYESFIAESNRVSELCADIAKEVCRPFEAYAGKMPALPASS